MDTIYESIVFNRVNAQQVKLNLISHLKEAPSDAEAWVILAACMYEDKEIEKAAKALEKAFQLQPDLPRAWLEKGRRFFLEKKWNDALTTLNQALALQPENDVILTFRGMVRRRMGEMEDAQKDFRAAVSINPMQEHSLWQLRMFEEQQQAFQEGSWVTIASHFDPDWLFMVKTMLLEQEIPTRISQQSDTLNLDASTDHNRKLQVRLEESEKAIWLVYDWARDYHYRFQEDFEDEELAEKTKPGAMKRTGVFIMVIAVLIIIGVLFILLTD